MAFTEDFTAFFLDFGVDATVDGEIVRVIFDNGFAERLGIGGSAPVAVGVTDDLASVVAGTAISIGATHYTVTAVEPDGTGMTLLRLQEA